MTVNIVKVESLSVPNFLFFFHSKFSYVMRIKFLRWGTMETNSMTLRAGSLRRQTYSRCKVGRR